MTLKLALIGLSRTLGKRLRVKIVSSYSTMDSSYLQSSFLALAEDLYFEFDNIREYISIST